MTASIPPIAALNTAMRPFQVNDAASAVCSRGALVVCRLLLAAASTILPSLPTVLVNCSGVAFSGLEKNSTAPSANALSEV